MSVARASGMPCGSVFGRFCVARFVRLEPVCGKISRNPYESMEIGVGMGVCLSAKSFV